MADSNARKPTEKEALFFLTILGAMKNKPEVDWDLVAQRSGYSNGNTAKTRFSQIKKAIGVAEDNSVGTSTPVKSHAKKVKSAVGSGTNITPSKVTKKAATPHKSKVTKGELAGLQAAAESFTSAPATGGSVQENEDYYDEDGEDAYDGPDHAPSYLTNTDPYSFQASGGHY